MSRRDFPAEEFAARRRKAESALKDAGLAWFLAFHPATIHWLTGSEGKSYQAFQCLLISADGGHLVMFTRESERNEFADDALADELCSWGGPEPEDPLEAFARLVRRLGLPEAGTIGMEVPAYFLHPHHYLRLRDLLGRATILERPNLIHDLRLVKSPRELAFLRKASRIADISVAALEGGLAVGRSELEVAAEVYRSIMAAGGDVPAVPLNFCCGPRAAYSHAAPTQRRLAQGDFGNAEYGVPYKRYTVSIGRQFSLGKPTARMTELYDIVRSASDACVAAIRDGVPATAPHEAAKRVIADAGLDACRIHTSGYAVAPAFPPATGEPLHLFGGSLYTLQAGMVLSVCPPIFVSGERLGVRIVDNVLVTENGAERLSRTSRELIVIDNRSMQAR